MSGASVGCPGSHRSRRQRLPLQVVYSLTSLYNDFLVLKYMRLLSCTEIEFKQEKGSVIYFKQCYRRWDFFLPRFETGAIVSSVSTVQNFIAATFTFLEASSTTTIL